MVIKISVKSAIPVLILILLANGIGISFATVAFAHEIDHVRHAHAPDLEKQFDAHSRCAFIDGAELDAATHLYLHVAGQYQPFYFIHLSLIPPLEYYKKLIAFIPLMLSDSILDSPYHPPRNI